MIQTYLCNLANTQNNIVKVLSEASAVELQANALSKNGYSGEAIETGREIFSDMAIVLNRDIMNNIDRVMFHDLSTIINWKDGTKTVVTCQKGDTFNKEVGFVNAVMKKLLGNTGDYNTYVKKYCVDENVLRVKEKSKNKKNAKTKK